MSRTSLLVSAAAILCLSACGGPSKGSPDPKDTRPSETIVSTGCADLIVLGARGSTQDPDKNYGVGGEARATAVQLAKQLHRSNGWTTRIVGVRYDAAASATQALYVEHVSDGARLMASRLKKLQATCPDARFVLIGFSQGAQVAHAAALDLPDSLAASVAAVAMIADPRRNPDDRIAQWTYGSAAPLPGRLGAGTPIGENLRDIAISFCVADDEICNGAGSPGQTPSKTHKEFYEQPSNARQTAKQIALILASH
ncbi:cutinase family protein [Aeromicrobium sp. P5_D10]